MLISSTETRFATNFLMVEWLFKLKLAIEQTIANLDWTIFVNTLCGNHHQKLFTKTKVVQANIKKNEFWDICANFVYMVELVLVSLKAFDGKQLCMGKAWLLMKILE
jgi:hypothetical protein